MKKERTKEEQMGQVQFRHYAGGYAKLKFDLEPLTPWMDRSWL